MRKFLFISSGVIFLLISAFLIFTGSGESDNMFLILSSAAVPFLFTAYWNFYSVYYESRINGSKGYFTFIGAGNTGIGVFYHKAVTVPFFLTLFGSSAFAISASLLSINSSTEDFAFVLSGLSVIYSAVIAVYFTVRLNRAVKNHKIDFINSSSDEMGTKIAFFFASIATLGLFPLIYYTVKSLKKKSV